MRKLSTPKFEAVIDVARNLLRGGLEDGEVTAIDFAQALVQVADSCVVGLSCAKHGGMIHGQEAEDLRAGVEQILRNTAVVEPADAVDVLCALRKSLIFLLDRVDACDSLAFLEVTDDAGTCGVESTC